MAKGISRAWFVVPAVLVLLGAWTVVSMRTGRGPRPAFEGRHHAVVTLEAPEGGGIEAGPALVERLVALGVDAQLLEADPRRVRLGLRKVSDPEGAVRVASTPEPLSFFVVDESQQGATEAVDAAGPGLLRPWRTAESRGELMAHLDGAAPPDGLTPLVECVPGPQKGGPPQCAAWLGRRAPLSAADLSAVSIGAHPRTEEPLVTFTFTPEGARALEEITRAAEGKMLAVRALGEVQARPRIDGPIERGSWTFSTRTGDTARPTAIERAQRIAAAAELPHLPPLRLSSVEE